MPTTKNNRISINALASTMQVIVTGLVYFLLYKFLLAHLGADQLGVWSLILSTSSIANLANFGLTSGLVKFVADYIARGDQKNIPKLVSTALVSITFFFIILTMIIYATAHLFIGQIVEPAYIDTALEILPYSLISLLINAIGGIFTSILEGYQLHYKRQLILTSGIIVFAVLCWKLTPIYKLLGVAYCQIIQSILIFIISGYHSLKLLPKFLTRDTSVLHVWDKNIFNSLISYGSQFQLISLCRMFYEPITKSLLSKYGGLEMVAYYEMSNRLVSQFRNLIVSANQVMIPVIATAAANDIRRVKQLYIKSVEIITFIEVPLISIIIILAPLISDIWIGRVDNHFLLLLYIQSFTAFILILNGPAYFGLIAEGKLKVMLFIHFGMLISNIVVSYFLCLISPTYGAAMGNAITVVVGAIILSIVYQRHHEIRTSDLFQSKDTYLLFAGILSCSVAIIINRYIFHNEHILTQMIIMSILYFTAFIPAILKNDKFPLLIQKITNFIPNN